MALWIADGWKQYRLLDCGGGERLEKWGKYTLVRPDPQAIWAKDESIALWKTPDGKYTRSNTGGGHWSVKNLPEGWNIRYKNYTFALKPMNFKHTGIFPEQASNWDFIDKTIKTAGREINVLNLFAYTGGATVAAAAAGASVCHVDAARGMVSLAKENIKLTGLSQRPVRYIVDDCKKFIEREIRRGHKYDAVIMDPPSYGRGPGGEVWKIEDEIGGFIDLCAQVLSSDPLFMIINSYTAGLSPSVMAYLLNRTIKKRFGGTVESEELGLPVESSGLCLPCGGASRWVKL